MLGAVPDSCSRAAFAASGRDEQALDTRSGIPAALALLRRAASHGRHLWRHLPATGQDPTGDHQRKSPPAAGRALLSRLPLFFHST